MTDMTVLDWIIFGGSVAFGAAGCIWWHYWD